MIETPSQQIERQLRDVDQCIMKLKYEGARYHDVNGGLALKAARLIKRQRKEIKALQDELAWHGIRPK